MYYTVELGNRKSSMKRNIMEIDGTPTCSRWWYCRYKNEQREVSEFLHNEKNTIYSFGGCPKYSMKHDKRFSH